MKVWIDICHTPQYNFFKSVIEELARRGYEVYVTVLDRGKTPKIVAKELEGLDHVNVEVIGKHKMTKWSAIWDANLMRVCKLIHWARGKKLDVAISTNIFTPLVGGLFGMKSYSFGDDPQVWDFHPKGWLSTKAYQTLYEWTMDSKQPKHTEVLRCLKEWAYLNPRTFVPKVEVLEKYGVKPKEYMFLREVTVGTINYAGQASGAILGIKEQIPAGMKVLFSLEEKKRRDEYPADWILLQEPIEDIHSLIYYSAGLVSSGDSMAREAALLGIPSYYLGIRYSMPANAAASKVASLQNQKTMPFEEWIGSLPTDPEECAEKQRGLREHIDDEFIDINGYMLDLVEGVKELKSERMIEIKDMKEAKYSYKNLEAYKESKQLVMSIYGTLKEFPQEEQYALCDQLRRAVISVPSNIAEGSGRTSSKDQAHFLEMAFGSLMEVDCQVDIAHDLGYIAQHDMDIINEQISRVAALLSGMRRKILGDNSLTR